jgi:hypothetical protein
MRDRPRDYQSTQEFQNAIGSTLVGYFRCCSDVKHKDWNGAGLLYYQYPVSFQKKRYMIYFPLCECRSRVFNWSTDPNSPAGACVLCHLHGDPKCDHIKIPWPAKNLYYIYSRVFE